MSYLKEKIDVRNVRPYNGKMEITIDEPLHKDTKIYLYYPEIINGSSELVAYQKLEKAEVSEDGRYGVKIYTPSTISDLEFALWLDQSKNSVAKHLFDDTVKEYAFASGFNSMFLTTSEIKANILSSMQPNSVRADIASLAMKLRLPIIEHVDLETILDIRDKYGESFANFRIALGNELINLRGNSNAEELKLKLDEIAYRINDVNVNEIDKDVHRIKRSIGVDASIITGSMLTSCAANMDGSVAGTALSLLGIASGLFVIAKEVSGDIKEKIEIKDRPEFFLWKLEKKAWKMK